MVTITNPKVSSVAPLAWKPYAGVSLLYDHPGSAALSGLEPLGAASPPGYGDQSLYCRLREVAEAIARPTRPDEGGLCPLPRYAYHVTLCDGINEGTRSHVHPETRPEVERTLNGLPDSLLWANPVMRLLRDPELRWSVWSNPITFRVEALSVWGHVLVANLEPADGGSVAAKASHEAVRSEFVARLRSRLGVRIQDWRPHLSLGYFANEHAAARARDRMIPAWQEEVRERTKGLSVTFRSASVYAFTDMISFWRLVH